VIYEKRRVLLDYVIYYIPPPQSSLPKRPGASAVTSSTDQFSTVTKSPQPDSGRSTPSSGSGVYSGGESPRSGQSSPVFTYDAMEVEEEAEPVQRVKVTRNRTAARIDNSSASAVPSGSMQVTGAYSSSTASNTAGQATASGIVKPSVTATSTPHVLALKNLVSLFHHFLLPLLKTKTTLYEFL